MGGDELCAEGQRTKGVRVQGKEDKIMHGSSSGQRHADIRSVFEYCG